MADENESDDALAAALARTLQPSEKAQASFKTMYQSMREAKTQIPKIESEQQYEEYNRIYDGMVAAEDFLIAQIRILTLLLSASPVQTRERSLRRIVLE